MADLYSNTEFYDLLDTDRKFGAVKRNWANLLEGKNIRTMLDVSIGTGTMTLPVCDLGVQLWGSDLSQDMLDKCAAKSAEKGWHAELIQSDFCSVAEKFDRQFDLVASTGNSLPHVPNERVLTALSQMDALVKPGGWLFYDVRNWDRILDEHTRFYTYNPTFQDDTRVNLVQVWDYNPDGTITFNLLYTLERDRRIFRREILETTYHPVRRQFMLDHLRKMGYTDIQVMNHPVEMPGSPEDADWYCVMAQKPIVKD
ncbi:MAG: class I SAM-dependent methyltransferase [Clostridia bacterium]|nr:class I SAM-dependent methyltransferase [Clostridia bacterium]